MSSSVTLTNVMYSYISTFLEPQDNARFRCACKTASVSIKNVPKLEEISKSIFKKQKGVELSREILANYEAELKGSQENLANKRTGNELERFVFKSKNLKASGCSSDDDPDCSDDVVNRITSSIDKFCEELQLQDEIQLRIEDLLNITKKVGKDISGLTFEIETEKKEILYKKKNLEVDNRIFELFGGEAAYNKIPIIDITNIEGKFSRFLTELNIRDLSRHIERENITSPVMRGVSRGGVQFFIIYADVSYRQDPQLQIFYETLNDHNPSKWYSSGTPIIKMESNYLISDKTAPGSNGALAYEALRSLIQTGSATQIENIRKEDGGLESMKTSTVLVNFL